MTPRTRRNLLRTLAVLIGGGLLLAMVGFGLFRSDPSWYRPVQLSEAEQVAGQQRLFDRLANLRNEVGRRLASTPATSNRSAKPPAEAIASSTFEIEMTENELNGVLMRWGGIDPRTRRILAHIQEPHVRFLPGRIEFAGRANGTLMSIEATVTQSDEGLPLVQLGRPWAGRLPLTRSLVEDPAAGVIADLRRSKDVPSVMVDALEQFIAGEPVTPIVPLMSSMQGEGVIPARVEKLVVEDGKLTATLRPVGDDAKSAAK